MHSLLVQSIALRKLWIASTAASMGRIDCSKYCFILIVSGIIFFTHVSSQAHGERRVLRCGVAHIPPYDLVTVYPNGSFHHVGASKIAAEWIAAKLNFSITFEYPTLDDVKEKGNDATTNLVTIDKADFTSNGYGITQERYARLEFTTYPLIEEGYRMAVPRPGEQDRLFAFIKPFDGKVWLLLGVSFIVVSLFMGLVTWLNDSKVIQNGDGGARKDNDTSNYLGQYFLYNVNVLTTHGDYLSASNNNAFLIGVGCWLLAASVLVYGYSSIVVSSITLPIMMPTVNSFEDVVAQPDISLIIRTDTYIGNLVNTNTDVPVYKALREKAMKRPGSIGNEGVINATKLFLTGKYAYPYADTVVRFLVATQYAREKKCRFKVSKRLPVSNSYFFSCVKKGNKELAKEISYGMMHLAETGLVRRWIRTLPWIPKADKCFAADDLKAAPGKASSIKLVDLMSAFFILGVGLGCSIFAFLVELTVFYRANRRRAVSHSNINQ